MEGLARRAQTAYFRDTDHVLANSNRHQPKARTYEPGRLRNGKLEEGVSKDRPFLRD